MPTYTLAFKPAIGLYGTHDPSAALFEDGQLVFAIEEERLSRQKHAIDTFPRRSIEACLEHAEITLPEIDRIYLPYDPPLRRKILPHQAVAVLREPGLARKAFAAQRTLVREVQAQLYPTRQIESHLAEIDTPVPPVVTHPHHACHAASAFHPSGFEEALVLTVDAKGEYDATVVWEGSPSGVERLRTYEHPNSWGLFFGIVTEYLGYRMFNGEGKVMGLAAYGEANPEIESALRSLVETGLDYDVTSLTRGWGTGGGIERLAELFDRPPREEPGSFTDWEKDLAFVAQTLLEEGVTSIVETYCERLGTANVALAGGVALNCKLNQRVAALPAVEDVFVQPVAHDAGLALGAGWLDQAPADVARMTHVYWGPEYPMSDVTEALSTIKLTYSTPENVERFVAERLADGDLVGWFQGRLELGPRALGNRSILADPRSVDSRDRVNRFVKHREEWRPFAPSMTAEAAEVYLEPGEPAPFMITTTDVVDERANDVPAVLHPGDGTTRPQTVRPDQNPRYHRLLTEFGRITGVPVLLNTSFNDHGEPIVNTPREAIKDFFGMGLDLLVVDDAVVEKPSQSGEIAVSVGAR